MKKFLVLTAIFTAVLLMISCGSNNKSENKEENPDSTETVTDEDPVETEPADTEQTDSEASDTTEPENGDLDNSQPDENDDSDNNENNDSDTEEVTKCRLDSTILDGEADSYFAFKGVGKIQDPSSWDWNDHVAIEVKFGGIEGKTKQSADKYSVFHESYFKKDDGSKENSIKIIVRDNKDNSDYFTTNIVSHIPISDITSLMENNVFETTAGPIVRVYDRNWTNDHAYYKECMIAKHKIGYNPDFDEETRIGKLKVCYENNNDFSVGETFKVAFFAELVTGQDLLDQEGVISAEDFCWCYNNKTGDEVDCSEIEF